MSKAIRLSPSGPILSNAGGGPFTPGAGARLRLTEAQCTIGGSLGVSTVPQVIGPTLGSTSFQVFYPDANAALEYRATVLLDVLCSSATVTSSAELYLDTSIDAGVTWVEQASNTHLVPPGVARQIRLDMALKVGNTLGLVGQEQLLVHARIGSNSGTANALLAESAITPNGDLKSVGAVYLSLEECF